ncbi:MAG: hypothetical protein J6W76_04950 [Spirochaetales bacterium]|nr:hypothetical protein [Spirochaetales bacterium]
MKKGLLIYLFLLMTLAAGESLERFEYTKRYLGSVFSGGKEQITVDNPDMLKFMILSNVQTKVDLFQNYARVRIFYTLVNKNKREPLSFRLSYPKIDMNLGREFEMRDAALNKTIDVSYEDKVIFGNYNDWTVTIDGVPEEYVNETDIEFETNIPFRIGDESLSMNEDGSFTDVETMSYLYRYGWYHVALRIEPSSSSTVVISYSVPLYQNVVNIKGSDDVNVEDPALNYDYYDTADGRKLLSDKVFSFYNYVPYSSDVRAKKRVYEFYSRLADDQYINVFPLKYKAKKKSISFVYANDRFGEIDNIYVKMSEYNSPNAVPSYYWTTDSRVIKDGRVSYVIGSGSEMVLQYNPKNKRIASSLLPKKDGITVSELHIYQGKPSADSPARTGNVKFEVTMSQKADFSDAVTTVSEVSLPVYDEMNPRGVVLYKGVPTLVKYIRVKPVSDSTLPIVLDALQIIQ